MDSYENYPIGERIKKAVGSHTSPMPAFFAYTKNARARKGQGRYKKINKSTMNRICNKFIKDTETRLKISNVEKFNWKMLSSGEEFNFNQEVCDLYSVLASDLAFQSIIDVEEDKENSIMIDDCMRKIESVCDIEDAYESILKFLFDGVLGCHSHRTNLFFQMFGDIYLRNIKRNLSDCKRCEFCGRRIPFWETDHDCGMKGVCEICGGSFIKKPNKTLCPECQKAQRKEYIRNKVAEHRLKKG